MPKLIVTAEDDWLVDPEQGRGARGASGLPRGARPPRAARFAPRGRAREVRPGPAAARPRRLVRAARPRRRDSACPASLRFLRFGRRWHAPHRIDGARLRTVSTTIRLIVELSPPGDTSCSG
jgi:hypothetical protein